MKKTIYKTVLYKSFVATLSLGFLMSCGSNEFNLNNSSNENDNTNVSKTSQEARIVSLSGTLTEILYELGLSEKIVATDVTSNYPEKIKSLPKVGHNRNVSTEGIMSQSPTHVIALQESFNPDVMEQLKHTGITTESYPFEYSVDGLGALVSQVSTRFSISYNSDSLVDVIKSQISSVKAFEKKPKVLFIYARGIGTLNVAGKGTKIQEMIRLAGAQNVALDFENFKPLTAESLIATNPDVILMFSGGYESLEKDKQLMKVPGIAETKAGKNNAFVTMDGAFLSSFSPRMGKAVIELNNKIHKTLAN